MNDKRELISVFDIFPVDQRGKYSLHTFYLHEKNNLGLVEDVFHMAGKGIEKYLKRISPNNATISVKRFLKNDIITSKFVDSFANFCKHNKHNIKDYCEDMDLEDCTCYWRLVYLIISDTKHVSERGKGHNQWVFEK